MRDSAPVAGRIGFYRGSGGAASVADRGPVDNRGGPGGPARLGLMRRMRLMRHMRPMT